MLRNDGNHKHILNVKLFPWKNSAQPGLNMVHTTTAQLYSYDWLIDHYWPGMIIQYWPKVGKLLWPKEARILLVIGHVVLVGVTRTTIQVPYLKSQITVTRLKMSHRLYFMTGFQENASQNITALFLTIPQNLTTKSWPFNLYVIMTAASMVG